MLPAEISNNCSKPSALRAEPCRTEAKAVCRAQPGFQRRRQSPSGKTKSCKINDLQDFLFDSRFARRLCGEDEIRTRGTGCPVRRFSKPVVSATHPPLRTRLPAVNSERVCKYRIFLGKYKEMRSKFVFLHKSSHPRFETHPLHIIYGVLSCGGILRRAARL